MALTVLLVTEAKFIYLENVHRKEKVGTMISRVYFPKKFNFRQFISLNINPFMKAKYTRKTSIFFQVEKH